MVNIFSLNDMQSVLKHSLKNCGLVSVIMYEGFVRHPPVLQEYSRNLRHIYISSRC